MFNKKILAVIIAIILVVTFIFATEVLAYTEANEWDPDESMPNARGFYGFIRNVNTGVGVYFGHLWVGKLDNENVFSAVIGINLCIATDADYYRDIIARFENDNDQFQTRSVEGNVSLTASNTENDIFTSTEVQNPTSGYISYDVYLNMHYVSGELQTVTPQWTTKNANCVIGFGIYSG